MKIELNRLIIIAQKAFLFVCLFIISPNALAYLDPGTGGMIVQAIIAIFIGAGLFIGQVKLKILNIFSSIVQKIKGEDGNAQQSDNNQTKE